MHRVLALIIALAVMSLGGATAQSTGWIDPSGAFSLQPESTGWRHLPELSEEGEVAFELAGEERVVRMCFIRSTNLPAPGPVTQEQVNARATAFRPNVEGAETHDLGTQIIDGVTVASFRLDVTIDRIVNHYRIFGLAQAGGGVTYNEVSCGGVTPVSAQHTAAFEAFLNSLRFHLEASP